RPCVSSTGKRSRVVVYSLRISPFQDPQQPLGADASDRRGLESDVPPGKCPPKIEVSGCDELNMNLVLATFANGGCGRGLWIATVTRESPNQRPEHRGVLRQSSEYGSRPRGIDIPSGTMRSFSILSQFLCTMWKENSQSLKPPFCTSALNP